ncbi:MAG: hypothetical protein DMG21_03505 [Acidobacteria bacterium]|nr:MAG: hypothetical protein DMG21_03505 [Acidobacteriota bacterium]
MTETRASNSIRFRYLDPEKRRAGKSWFGARGEGRQAQFPFHRGGRTVRIEVRFQDEVAILNLEGRFLAGGDGPFLRQKVKDLIDAGVRDLVINFDGVPYIDSTGLGFLAGSRITTQNAGAKLVLASVNEHVRKILDGVRLTQFFDLAPDEAAALKQLKEKKGTLAAVADAPGAKLPRKKR